MKKSAGKVGAVITGLAIAAVVGLAVAPRGGSTPQAAASDVPGIPNCGGNSQTHWVEVGGLKCANTKTFTVKGVTFTVTAVTQLNHGGSGTVTYSLDKTLSEPVPVRVASHIGVSGNQGGARIFDSIADGPDAIPAGSLTYVLPIRYACGQIDIKAVFTAPGDARGRISGPFVCDREVVATTTTTTPETTTTTPGETTTTGPAVSIVTTTPTTVFDLCAGLDESACTLSPTV